MLGELVASALGLGLFGSAHCAVMCGPLAAAGCTAGRAVKPRELALYLAGRLVSYACAGALLGHAGRAAARALSLEAAQAVLLGAVALAAVARGVRLLRGGARDRAASRIAARAAPSFVAGVLGALVPRRGLALGIVTGALPCGLLAAAWALAAVSGHPLHGALVMLAFAAATAPALVASVVAAARIGRWATSPVVSGLAWCALGVWIGVRPLLVATGHCH